MDIHSEYFDGLPDEVIHLIFSFILDCKSLVRCMSVSKAFREQAVRITSLSIICPGNFSSYDERLHKIYGMVKAFKFLNSLVVRVGQPKEEPPSWARCMRYAEIGSSVEKFVFMAAKSGDFSELDLNLMGLKDTRVAPTESQCEEENISGQGNYFDGLTDVEENGQEAWSDGCSDEARGIRQGTLGYRKDEIQCSDDSGVNDRMPGKKSNYSKATFDASILQEVVNRKQLSSFCLRRVVAPTNDVLTRMLPVIHFAIVQGLNELRDAMPPFISQFPELRRLLLVDMAESITVFLREHHIDEMKALYLQELDELAKVHNNSLHSGGDDIKETSKAPIWNLDDDVNIIETTTKPLELLDSSGSSEINISQEIPEFSGNGVSDSILPLTNEQDEEIRDVARVSKSKEKKGKSITNSMINGTYTYRRKKGEFQTMFPLSRSYFPKNMGICKGKSKALEHNDSFVHVEGCSSQHTSTASVVGNLNEPSTEGDTNDSLIPSSSNLNSANWVPNHLHLKNPQPASGHVENTSYGSLYLSRSLSMNVQNVYIQNQCSESDPKLVLKHPSLSVEDIDKESDEGHDAKVVKTGKGTISSGLPSEDASRGCLRFDVLDDEEGSKGNSTLPNYGRSKGCMGLKRGNNIVTGVHHDNKSHAFGPYCMENPSRNNYLHKELRDNKSDSLTKCNESNNDSLTECDEPRGNSASIESHQLDVVGQRNDATSHSLLEYPDLPMERSSNNSEMVCRRTWQERVTRLRDYLRVGPPGQEHSQHRRERSRELLRKRQRAMEKDALSFDYTFWRSDQVSSCNYVMSDISMCIVTNAAKPLGEADKEVLTQAAIAGPLLVATVSHVNKQYTCHNL